MAVKKKQTLADFAARLAGAHIRAISCKGNKKPLVKWKIAAAISAATWARAETLAIVCGENGLTAFDFDGESGAALFENVRALLPTGTYIEKTPRGGVHVVSRTAGVLPKSGRIGSLPVEVKAGGCLLTIAPSPCYSVLSGDLLKLPTADPAALLNALGGMAGPRVTSDDGRISTGNRSAALTSILGAARRFGAGESALVALAHDVDTHCFAEAFGADKLEQDARGMTRYTPAVRTLPEIKNAVDLAKTNPALRPIVIDGLLRLGHKAALTGPSKAGKTFSLICLALAVALGVEWFGFRCTRGRVLFVNLEVDYASFWARVCAVAQALDVSAALENLAVWSLRGHTLDPDRFANELLARITAGNFAAVIIDPIYKIELAAQGADENAAGPRAAVLRALDRIAEAGPAVIFSAHHPKGSQAHRAAIDRASGSGVLARDVDALVCLTELDTSGCYRVEFVCRDFLSPQPFGVRWDYPLHTRDEALNSISLRGEKRRAGSLSAEAFRAAWETARGADGTATIKALKRLLGVGSHATYWRCAMELRQRGGPKLLVGRDIVREETA